MHRRLAINCSRDRRPRRGCAGDQESSQPSFYRSLATPNAEVDASAAQSMISGYRRNNGLGPVTLDPGLMRLASEQSVAMAQRDKLDHNAARSFNERIAGAGFPTKAAVENVGAGYHTLAEAFSGWREFPAAPRQYAQPRRDAHGHRRGLLAELEVQSVLDAHHGSAR